MDKTSLGPFEVSRLCLGCMLMGGKTPAEESRRMLDRFLEAGGNFLDTADVYGDGESERTLAPWLKDHRDEVVLATKVRMATSEPPGEGLAPDRRVGRPLRLLAHSSEPAVHAGTVENAGTLVSCAGSASSAVPRVGAPRRTPHRRGRSEQPPLREGLESSTAAARLG